MRVIHAVIVAVVALVGACSAGSVPHHGQTIDYPGYRPPSSLSTAFVDNVATAEIAVFPTIVRSPYISRFSSESQLRVVEFLERNHLGTARAVEHQFNLGAPEGRSQFEMFLNTMQKIGEQLREDPQAADYVIVLEVLFPPARSGVTEVFGIHCFVLTPDGDNAFSFLLNSHHKAFVDARLRTSDMTADGKEKLAVKSTAVAMAALEEQVGLARSSVAETGATASVPARPGVLDDFESALPTGTDSNGIQVGFFTFSDGKSEVEISTTDAHPPIPGEADGNRVLRIDLDVTGWAGVLHNLENPAVDAWTPQDWSAFGEISFWLYGRNSGTGLFFHVLDNRSAGSTSDDAERYAYDFADDFAGWRLVVIPFADMKRQDVGNGAPIDGLGLSEVHGWALGATHTDGQVTYFVDDIALGGKSALR